MIRVSSGGYYNEPVADWARRNIRGRVEVTPRFSSRLGRIFAHALLFGQSFPWGKLYYVDHVTKVVIRGGVRRRIKDNQLELVFEGGKLVVPPMIHARAEIWALVNSMPAEVRDDGVPRPSVRPLPAMRRTGPGSNY